MDRPNFTLLPFSRNPAAPLLEADALVLQRFNWKVKMRMVLFLVTGTILTTS